MALLPKSETPSSQHPTRVALLGPRRVRQGLGPYFASALSAAGARVVSFGVGRPTSIEPAAAELRERLGYEVHGSVGVEDLLASTPCDALVIASPIESHEDALHAALDAGVHVLCEKPLLVPNSSAARRADALARDFAAAGLHLMVHAQWPETIPSYFELFPSLRASAQNPTQFHMRLAPSGLGAAAIVDSLSHPISLLQALAPDPNARIAEARILRSQATARHELDWRYLWSRGEIACSVELQRCEAPPRPAGWGIESAYAERRIAMPEYALSFVSSDPRANSASVQVPDPLFLRVRRFVDTVASKSASTYDFATGQRMRMLTELLAAYPS